VRKGPVRPELSDEGYLTNFHYNRILKNGEKKRTGNCWCTKKLRNVLIAFQVDYYHHYKSLLFRMDAVIGNI
jgi:hypothetical protein